MKRVSLLIEVKFVSRLSVAVVLPMFSTFLEEDSRSSMVSISSDLSFVCPGLGGGHSPLSTCMLKLDICGGAGMSCISVEYFEYLLLV